MDSYVYLDVEACVLVMSHVHSLILRPLPCPPPLPPNMYPIPCAFSKSQGGKIFIGLNLKFTKRNEELLGYSRYREDRGWSFSDAAVGILKEFKEKFPTVFDCLEQHPSDEVFYEDDLFPNKDDR